MPSVFGEREPMSRLGVQSETGGWVAVLYDSDGPIRTGIGYYPSREEAEQEARDWARAEGHCIDFDQGRVEVGMIFAPSKGIGR
jgi:hypothetical protein